MIDKTARTPYPIEPLIAQRWSPRVMDPDRPVPRSLLASLLAAAVWAPSCFNEQPWRYLILDQGNPDALARGRACLVEGNAWARRAPVLLLACMRTSFTHNGKPNRHAAHDLGAASVLMHLEAQARGLALHQMAGFDAEAARKHLAVPADLEPMVMIAIGWPGSLDGLSEEARARETAPRTRRPLVEVAYEGSWDAGWSSHAL